MGLLLRVRRSPHQTPWKLDDFLKPLVVLLIVLWCGPEVFAVVELTTLLELLGATLFLFAFGTSFRALALSMVDFVARVLVSAESRVLITTSAGLGAMLIGLRFMVLNAVVVFGLCFAILSLLNKA